MKTYCEYCDGWFEEDNEHWLDYDTTGKCWLERSHELHNKTFEKTNKFIMKQQEKIEKLEDICYELKENLKAAEEQNHYHTLMCYYRDEFFKLTKELK